MSAILDDSGREYIQGTSEWLQLRKTKITATDASVIMKVNPWKTPLQLYHEKLSDEPPKRPNAAMQRGIDLEPIARDLFIIYTGINMQPEVVVKDFMMASLDGRDPDSGNILEIKCPGQIDHAAAVAGSVPDHYHPQLQHQMYVCGVQSMYYFSFDGNDGVIVEVKRDDDYIKKMIDQEKKFYECLMNKTPPDSCDRDYIEKEDPLWKKYASKYKETTLAIKELEMEEEKIRKQLVFLAGELNAKGEGITLCRIHRKGSIDYSRIPELGGVDLEKYRKASSNSWRITCS